MPRSASAPEGDGWVIAVVYRGVEDRSDFIVFDAEAIEAGPIGVAKLPRGFRSASTATGGQPNALAPPLSDLGAGAATDQRLWPFPASEPRGLR